MVSERLEWAGRESLSAGAQTLAPAAPRFVHRPHALWADRTNRDHLQRSMTWCSWRRDRSADAPLQSLTRMQPMETGRMAKLVMPGQKREARLRARCPGHPRLNRLEGMRLGWGRDDGPFFFSCPGRKPHERCEPGPILLCMGLFSRFCVWALRYLRRGAVSGTRDHQCCALTANRFNSNRSCCNSQRESRAVARLSQT